MDKETAQELLVSAVNETKQPGEYRVFGQYDRGTDQLVEVVRIQDALVERLPNGALVNVHDLPNGTKAGKAIYLGTIKVQK